jgi:hypothetical protein
VFWQVGALGNLMLLGVVIGSSVIQLALHHTAWTQRLFGIGELSLADGVLTVGLGLVSVTILELRKLVRAVCADGTAGVSYPAGT